MNVDRKIYKIITDARLFVIPVKVAIRIDGTY